MIEKIAMWGGFAGIIVAVVAMIVLFLTRQNILDILDRDVILFDKNFELKKQAIEQAMLVVDELEEKGEAAKSYEFVERSKKIYNELLCVVSDVRVADEFYNLTIEQVEPTSNQFAHFKLMCRHDIGLSNKKAKLLKRNKAEVEQKPATKPNFDTGFENPRPMPYNQPRSTQPVQPTTQTQPRPMPRPQPRPTAAGTQPTATAGTQPRVANENTTRPVPVSRPMPRITGDPSNRNQ